MWNLFILNFFFLEKGRQNSRSRNVTSEERKHILLSTVQARSHFSSILRKLILNTCMQTPLKLPQFVAGCSSCVQNSTFIFKFPHHEKTITYFLFFSLLIPHGEANLDAIDVPRYWALILLALRLESYSFHFSRFYFIFLIPCHFRRAQPCRTKSYFMEHKYYGTSERPAFIFRFVLLEFIKLVEFPKKKAHFFIFFTFLNFFWK